MTTATTLPCVPAQPASCISREQLEEYAKAAVKALRQEAGVIGGPITISPGITFGSSIVGGTLAAVSFSQKFSKTGRWAAGIGAALSGLLAGGSAYFNHCQRKANQEMAVEQNAVLGFVDNIERDPELRKTFMDWLEKNLTPSELNQDVKMNEHTLMGKLVQFGLEKNLLDKKSSIVMTSLFMGRLVNSFDTLTLSR